MLKYKYIYIFLFLILFSLGALPIANGVGCNAVIDIDISYLHMSGRCENGRINATFHNKPLDEIYFVSGRILVFSDQYIVLVDRFKYIRKNNDDMQSMRRYLYNRRILSGRIIKKQYILTYTPFALIGVIKITGKMSFV